MLITAKTDTGKVRKTNQDAYFTGKLNENVILAVVCDGMGGANAGNIASETATKLIADYVGKSYRNGMSDGDLEKLLKSAVVSANIEIYDMSLKNSEYLGMGTTAVAAVISESSAVICHVGDSRAYLVSENLITQLTRDHSVVQTLVESGKLTPEEAKVHPRKNVITRALGAEEDVVPDCVTEQLSNGDTVMICTDGLSNFVEASKMLDIFRNNDISRVAEALIMRANANGGGDNITVVTVTV